MSELELVNRAKNGEARAMNDLIRKWEPLAFKMVRTYRWMQPKHSHEDLMQMGRLGIYKAVHKFDPKRGNSFMTVAFPTVRGSVQGLARKDLRAPECFSLQDTDVDLHYNHVCKTLEAMHTDTLKTKVQEVIEAVCGDLDCQRARIICDYFGVCGHTQLRNIEICERYGISKQNVVSYVTKFTKRARKLFPELETLIKD